MTNLLRANFSRMRRDRTFWLCIIMVLGCSIGFMVLWCVENAEKGAIPDLDAFYFRLSAGMGFFYAVFTCLFLSTEYGEGTIRNKITVGHTRRDIYLANFFTVFAASLLMALAWLIGGLVGGVPFLGFLQMGPAEMICCIAVIIGFTAAFSAINSAVSMLNDRRSAQVITIAIWLILMLVSSFFENALHEPEFLNSVIMYVDGVQMADPAPTPYYIAGIQRDIYEFVVDFLPTGQLSLLQNINLDHPVRMLLSSLFITVAAVFGGLKLFERKDLK